MNCANHPETPAVAFCQYCGKPLCAQCIHKVNNVISCEPCLAARVHAATAAGYGGPGSGPASPHTGPIPATGFQRQPWGREPAVAFALGFIPGVGAMYNGQFAKGIAHVIIFVLLVDFTKYNGLLGLLIAAWIIYQVFDAYQTAVARRDGLPLPNPLGLNNVEGWFGARGSGSHRAGPSSSTGSGTPDPSTPAASPEPFESTPSSGFASGYVPPYTGPPMPPVPPNPYDAHDLWHSRGGRGIPTGAVILIVLGVLFLLGNMGILSQNWLDRGWPILLIALGVWIVIRRSQTPPAGGVR